MVILGTFICRFADQEIDAQFVENIGAGVMITGTGEVPQRFVPATEVAACVAKVAGWNQSSSTRNEDSGFSAAAQR